MVPRSMEHVCVCLVSSSLNLAQKSGLWAAKSSLGPPVSTAPQWSQPVSQKALCGWGLGARIVPSFYILWLFLKTKKLKTKHYQMGVMRARGGFTPSNLSSQSPPLPVSFPQLLSHRPAHGESRRGDEMKLIPIKCFWIFFFF